MSGAKRAPSSSVKKADADRARRSRCRACSSVSITSRPASTPRLPSKRPPVRTVSMCEPVITGAASGSRPGPGGDDVADRVDRRRRARGRASTPTTRSRPSRSASVSARRAQPRSPFGPVDRADLAERLDARPAAGRCRCAGRRRSSSAPGTRRRRSRASASANAVDRGLEQLRAVLGGGGGRVADDAVGAEVVRQPPERHRAAEAHVAVGGELLGDVAARPRDMSTRSGARCSISDVSSVPPWTPMPSSSAADGPPWSGGTPGWARNVISPWRRRSSRLATPSSAELPPWPLKNTSLPGRRHGDAAADVVEHGEQRRRPTARSCPPTRRARSTSCRRAAAAATRRARSPTRSTAASATRVGDQQVGAERQVRAVLLDRAERLHEDAARRSARSPRRGRGGRLELAVAAITSAAVPGMAPAHERAQMAAMPRPERTTSTRSSIGAGHNGLVAAAYLARAGLSTCCSRRATTSAARPPARRSPGRRSTSATATT